MGNEGKRAEEVLRSMFYNAGRSATACATLVCHPRHTIFIDRM